jgi:hypothetical protein
MVFSHPFLLFVFSALSCSASVAIRIELLRPKLRGVLKSAHYWENAICRGTAEPEEIRLPPKGGLP